METATSGATGRKRQPKAKDVPSRVIPAAASREASRQMSLAMAFSQAVSVLMRAPNYRQLPIASLETLLLPPLMTGQCRIGFLGEKSDARREPRSVVAWARVSDAVDRRLQQNLDQPMVLSAADWTSGKHPWLIVVAGDERIIPGLLAHIHKSEFAGGRLKMRANMPDGTVQVRTIGD